MCPRANITSLTYMKLLLLLTPSKNNKWKKSISIEISIFTSNVKKIIFTINVKKCEIS